MKKVLIVDDDVNLLQMYRVALEQAGYEVTIHSSSIDALNTLSKDRFDLIVLDMIMPHVDGLLFLSKIRETPTSKDTPVMVLTNYGADDLVSQTEKLGIVDYLLKYQCTPESIVQKVSQILNTPPEELKKTQP